MCLLKSEPVSNTLDIEVRMRQQVFGFGDNAVVYRLLGADPGMFPDQEVKAVGMDF